MIDFFKVPPTAAMARQFFCGKAPDDDIWSDRAGVRICGGTREGGGGGQCFRSTRLKLHLFLGFFLWAAIASQCEWMIII